MASSSASRANSGFPPAGSTTAGLDNDKVGGGGGGVKVGGGGGGVKLGGGGGVKVGGFAKAGEIVGLVRLLLALFSSNFLNCSSSAAADELVCGSHSEQLGILSNGIFDK